MVVKNKTVQITENRSLMDELYKIQKKDIKQAANVLADAFYKDPMNEKMNADENLRRTLSKVLLKFSLRYGNVVSTSENLEGVMTITPHDKEMTFWRIVRSGAFFTSMKLIKLQKMMMTVEKTLKEVKKNLNLGEYIFLPIIGVSQEFQGKGYGGKLLRAIIEKADKEGKPIYLETQKEKNVSLYEKYGSTVREKIILPEPINIPDWLMVRDIK